MTATSIEDATVYLLNQAENDLSHYPQYSGHWNGWVLAKVTRDVKTKLGMAFRRGDLVLVEPDMSRYERASDVALTQGFRTCYSHRNRVNTSVKVTDLVLLDTTAL